MRRTYETGIYLITFCWGLYCSFANDTRFLLAFASAVGTMAAGVLIPHVISILTVRTGTPNHADRRFNRFVILWAFFMLLQLIVYANEK